MEKPVIAFVHPPAHEAQGERFVRTFTQHPPEYPHYVVVILNGVEKTAAVEERFMPLTSDFFHHDDTGWDIGAYIAFGRKHPGPVFFCGGHTHFKREGWLRRLACAWDSFGPGLYGTSASYEVRPHINTTGFLTVGEWVGKYPIPVRTKFDRYVFEHGPSAYHVQVSRRGAPVKLVTWDGMWDRKDWRKPPNIFRRGDQSNMLAYFNHTEEYDNADPAKRRRLEKLADTKTGL